MDNEIEISEFGKAKDLYANPLGVSKDLVEIYNNQLASQLNTTSYAMDKSKVVSYKQFFDSTGLSPLYIASGVGVGLVALTGWIFINPMVISNVAITVLGSIPVSGVGFFMGFPLAHTIYKKFDASRLAKYAKTNNSKKRTFYTNRVLDGFLINNPKNSELFNNHFILAYALWFHENGRELRALGNDKLYRKLFKNSTFLDFTNDQKNFAHYVRLARDMNEGKFTRSYIPRIAQTDEEIAMFEEYAYIIENRKDSEKSGYQTFEEIDFEQKSRDLVKWKNERDKQHLIDEKEQEIRESQNALFNNFRKISIGKPSSSNNIIENVQPTEYLSSNDPSPDRLQDSTSYQSDMKTLTDIETEWFATQKDIVQLLKYPLLSDMNEPLVKEFHTRLSFAKSLSVKRLNNDFVLAVSNLGTSWNSLVHEAHKVEMLKFSEDERKKIILAKKLMDIALNAASTPSERQSAYKKAMEQLQGLVVIPKSAIMAIDQAVNRLALDEFARP